MPFDFTGQNIENTYQRLVQTDGTSYYDGTGSLLNLGSSDVAESVHIAAKNTSGVTITKGTPVYITGNVGGSEKLTVAAADASDPSKMPAVGLSESDLDNDGEGFIAQGGYLKQIKTDIIDGVSATSNDTVYIKAGGGLTLTKPTGSNLIQNIAKVARIHQSNGSLIVSSILRTNDVPNFIECTQITASVISASGAITASNLSGTNTGDQDLSPYLLSSETGSFVLDSQTGSFAVTGSNVLFTNVTASTVSASGGIIGGGLNISGPENSHIEVGTYNIGYDASPSPSLYVTGSGLIVSGVMADTNHHNFIKIGETELVDIKNPVRSAFLIHNVDQFIVSTGSDGGDLSGQNQLLIEHTGDDFRVFSAGTTIFNYNKTSDTLQFGTITGTSTLNGDVKIRAANTTETYNSSRYIATFDSNPNTTTLQVKSFPANTFFKAITGAVTASAVSASGDIVANSITASIHGGTF